jgi:predicted Zn-dependent peptidase
VTAADVCRVANQYIDPNRMVVVLVGDRSKIEAGSG